MPIPIEWVVEFRLGLDIAPMPGMRSVIGEDDDSESFLTGDLTCIYVDENIQQKYSNRYRFSLAHEVAHYVLHKAIYSSRPFNDMEGWVRFTREFPKDKRGLFEWQAYTFAGLILVPSAQLRDQVGVCERECKDILSKIEGITPDMIEESRPDFVLKCLSKVFLVSEDVISRRLRKDGFTHLTS